MTKTVVSGVLLLDKPAGISSHNAMARAKRLFMSSSHDSKKAGHAGTLDPMATGLLPICLGEATKFVRFGLDADKGYQAVILLGSQTDTGDAEGTVVATSAQLPFDQSALDTLAKSLIGTQAQTPPMYSALKKDGKKLYEYARAGIHIEREARRITIHTLSLSKLDEQHIGMDVTCSKGTYVRALGELVADKLGMVGHLVSLRRTHTGGFVIDDAIDLHDLEAMSLAQRLARLLPIDAFLTHLPTIPLSTTETARIRHGQRLNVRERMADISMGQAPDTAQVRLYHGNAFVGLAEVASSGRLQPIKLIADG